MSHSGQNYNVQGAMQQILFLLMTLISKEFLGLRRKFLVVERNDSLDNSIGLPV